MWVAARQILGMLRGRSASIKQVHWKRKQWNFEECKAVGKVDESFTNIPE